MQALVKIILHLGSQSSIYLHSSKKINATIPPDVEQEYNSMPQILIVFPDRSTLVNSKHV
jgi:hypothetical protein